jgi:hypothetical protein
MGEAMVRLYEDIIKRLTVIENMYDVIRIEEPNKKAISTIQLL